MLATPENAEKYAFLKDDPDLAHVWEDVQKSGPVALQKASKWSAKWHRRGGNHAANYAGHIVLPRGPCSPVASRCTSFFLKRDTSPRLQYWDDDELMSKISAKMRSSQQQRQAQMEKDGMAPKTPIKQAAPILNLFDAAKAGDASAARKMIEEEGADVNAKVHGEGRICDDGHVSFSVSLKCFPASHTTTEREERHCLGHRCRLQPQGGGAAADRERGRRNADRRQG